MYYDYISSMMAEMAKAIGKQEEAVKYERIFNKISSAFLKHYKDANGQFKTYAATYGNGEGYVDGNMGFDGHTQTAYANAIYIQILKPELQGKEGNWLVELIQNNGDHEIVKKWWDYMADIMDTNEDNSPVSTPLVSVFNLD